MNWPDNSDLPVEVHAAFGADINDTSTWSWTDLSRRLLDESITIQVKPSRGATTASPGTCTVTLNNADGALTPLHPLSEYYPDVELGTPLRVRLRYGEDSFSRTVASGLGTSDSGQAWTTVNPSSWSVGSGHATASINVLNTIRRVLYGSTLLDAERRLTITPSAALTGASLVWRGLFRYQDSSNYYSCAVELDRNTGAGLTITCKIRRTTTAAGTVEIAVASPVPGLLYTAGQPVHMRAGIAGARLGVKAWIGTPDDEPPGWSVEVDDYAFTTPGLVGEEWYLVAGNTNTLPYTVQLDDYALYVDRFSGFADQWNTAMRPGVDEDMAVTEVTASGILRRFTQGEAPIQSPYRRTIGGAHPAAYWPVEDGIAAGQAGSAIPGHPALTVSGTVEFQEIDPTSDFYLSTSTYGTSAMANLAQGGSLSAPIPGDVTAACVSAWTALVVARVDYSTISADVILMDLATPGGTYVRWTVVISGVGGAHTKVIAYNAAGAASTLIDDSTTFVLSAFALSVAQIGPNLVIDLYLNDDTPHASTSTAGTLAGPTSIGSNTTRSTSSIAMPIGHVTLMPNADGLPFPAGNITDIYGNHPQPVRLSWRGEAATNRLLRLTAEDGIPLNIPVLPTANGMVRMGDQLPGTAMDLYQECVDADGGVLYEQGYGLAYLPRESRYNPQVVMTIDLLTYLSTTSDYARVLNPAYDDRNIVNTWTVTRPNGSEATAQDEPSLRRGRYRDEIELNLLNDLTLLDQAAWRAHISAVVELRDDVIPIDLAGNPGLIDQWLLCGIGSRIRRINPPAQHPGIADRIIDGWTETIGRKVWRAQPTTSPAEPWDVGTLDGEQRVAADGSTVGTGGLTLGGTSFPLTSTAANGLWTTAPSQAPLDARVDLPGGSGGEVVRLSGITGGSSPQTANVSARGITGTTRAWPAGASVDVAHPFTLAL